MHVKAQVAMVMNLDKCIGCHTCSVTCKQVWTNRPGTEYVWFNNVETAPGPGLSAPVGRPGALERRLGARPQGPAAAEGRRAGQEAPDDLLQPRPARRSTTTTSRSPTTTRRSSTRRSAKRDPVARPHSQLTGKPMDVKWGPELGRGPRRRPGARRPRTRTCRACEEQVRMTYEQAFMFFLPRICEHCLNPSCVASCPVGRDVQARGGRHRPRRPGPLPRLALLRLGLPVQEGLLQPPHRQGREVHALLPADRDRPADDLLGDLRRAHPLPRPRPLRRRPRPGGRVGARRARPARRAARRVPRPRGPRGRRRPRGATASRDDWIDAARRSPIYDLAMRWGVALPLHPEFRTLPMVWYVPPLSPVVSTLEIDGYEADPDDVFGAIDHLRIPLEYLANLLTAGDVEVVRGVLHRLAAMRAYMRKREVLGETDESLPGRVGLTGPELERMYRLLAIADYEDRYVIPQAHAELGERLMQEQGGCGLDFDGGPGNCGAVDPRPDTLLARRALRRRGASTCSTSSSATQPVRRRRGDAAAGPWALLSFLLRYPDARVAGARAVPSATRWPRCPPAPVRDALERFLAGWTGDQRQLAARYVETFDLRRRASLHLTYYAHGDTRERGMALLRLKKLYRAAGLPLESSRAARPPAGDARVRRARPARLRRGAAGRAPAGDRAAAALAARPRQPVRARARRGRGVAARAQRDRARRGRAARARGAARRGGRPGALRPAGGDADGSAAHERGRDPAVDHPAVRRDGDVRRRALVALPHRPVRLDERARRSCSSTRSSAGPDPRSTTARSPRSAAT